MAHIEPYGLMEMTRFLHDLENFTGHVEDVAKACVKASLPVVESAYRGAMQGRVPRPIPSFTEATKIKKNHLGIYSVARAVGRSERSHTRYGAIAAFYHYGVPKRHIPATGWHDAALAAAEAPAVAAMEKEFQNQVNKYLK